MRLSMAPIRGLSITVLMVASLFMAAACAEEPTATPAPAPTATATPAPTPTPTPTPSAADYLAAAGANIGAMQTAKFSMVDETGTGALFFGATFKSMEAVLKAPDGLRMLVDVVAPGFGFLEIEMIKVGDQAFVKLSKNARWSPLPVEQVPFNFAGLGMVFVNLPATVQNVAMTGRETVQGAQTIRIEGVVASEALLDLITSADPGNEVTLTLWIDETEFILRQVRLVGQIYNADAPETSRLLTIEDINVPVDIELPDITSGP